MKLNEEMNSKYNTYDHLDKLKCIEEEEILNMEKKFEPFSIDKNYNYATNMANEKNSLPNINLNLSKIVEFYKNSTIISIDELINEINSINKYFGRITNNITLQKVETKKEKSIIYYLFYFMSRAFFYIIMSNNFILTKSNCLEFTTFFRNYNNIIKTAKLYIKEDISNSNLINHEQKEGNVKMKKSDIAIYEAFEQLKKYPNEFKEAVESCQNFLILIIFSIEEKENSDPMFSMENNVDQDMITLLEIFVDNMDLLYKVNKYFSIIDYKNFYNDGISKKINLKYEFINYLKNLKIKKLKNKQKEKDKIKDKEKDEEKDEEDKKDLINIDDDEDDDEELEIKDGNYKKNFTLLKYMWLFNPGAKNDIIILFNNYQRRNELIKSVNEVRPTFFSMGLIFLPKNIFLNINVRRKNLIEDTLNEISRPDIKLQNPIKVKFIGEQGVDEGGVRKEFFLLFIRQIFDPQYGMFNYNTKTRLYWFNHYTFEPKIKYELIGIILGLAIYNNIILDVKFPLVVYKKILGIKPNIEDMKECDPELYNNLMFLMNSKDKNLKEDLDTDFTIIDDKFGEKLVIPLKSNGKNIMVDIDNKDEYVELYLDWYFNKSIDIVFNSFERGFYRVFNKIYAKF